MVAIAYSGGTRDWLCSVQPLDKGFLTRNISESAALPGVDIRNSIRRFAPEAQKENRSEHHIGIGSGIGHAGSGDRVESRELVGQQFVAGYTFEFPEAQQVEKQGNRFICGDGKGTNEHGNTTSGRRGSHSRKPPLLLSCALIVMCFAACLLSSPSLIAQQDLGSSVALPESPEVRQPFVLRAVTDPQTGKGCIFLYGTRGPSRDSHRAWQSRSGWSTSIRCRPIRKNSACTDPARNMTNLHFHGLHVSAGCSPG